MTHVTTIAATELRLILRSKTVLFSATAMPLAFAVFVVAQREATASAGVAMLGMVMTFFALFSIYATVTTTAVTRRQDLYLKRLRSGESSDVSILAGIVAPPVLLCLVQTLVVFAAMFAIGVKFPGQWWWGVVAFLGIIAVCTSVALATAAVTPNPSAAQLSSLPFAMAVLGTFVAAPVTENRWFDLTPGGAVVTLVRAAYELDLYGSIPVAVASLVLWTWGGVDLTKRLFRWEART